MFSKHKRTCVDDKQNTIIRPRHNSTIRSRRTPTDLPRALTVSSLLYKCPLHNNLSNITTILLFVERVIIIIQIPIGMCVYYLFVVFKKKKNCFRNVKKKNYFIPKYVLCRRRSCARSTPSPPSNSSIVRQRLERRYFCIFATTICRTRLNAQAARSKPR